MGIKLLKKMTLRDIAGKPDIKALVAFDNQTAAVDPTTGQAIPRPTLWLANILGVANDYKPGETALGPFVRFLGQFKGTNLATGESKFSSSVIMPGAIPAQIYSALKAGAASVQFGFKIGIHFDDSAAVKYVYDVESLFELADSDPISLLEKALGTGRLPELSAPAAPAALPEPVTGVDTSTDIAAAQAAAAAPEAPASNGKGKRKAA